MRNRTAHHGERSAGSTRRRRSGLHVTLAALAAPVLLAASPAAGDPAGPVSVGPGDATFWWIGDTEETGRVTIVREGDAPGAERVVEAGGATRHHVIEVDGLEPETTYRYRLGGEDGPTGAFATPAPPPGDVVGVVFVMTDIHLCVDECGQGARRLASSRAAYSAVLADVRSRMSVLRERLGESLPTVTLILGDLTQRPGEAETAAVADLAAQGPTPCPIPGNHEKWDDAWARHFEALVRSLGDSPCRYDGTRATVDVGTWRVLLLDSAIPDGVWGELGTEQIGWIDEQLSATPDRPTLLAMHHPVAVPPAAALFGDGARNLYLHDAGALDAVLARHHQVAAILSGHVHANWTGTRGAVTQFVFSALVQYPMGYHSLTLYEGGLVRRFHPLAANAEEAEASARGVAQWARDQGVPLPDLAVGMVFGAPDDRSSVLVLPGAAAPAGNETTEARVAPAA